MTNHESNWLTIREAALAAGVSELTIRRRIKDGRIPHRLVGGKYFVDDSSLHGSSESAGASPGRIPRIEPSPDQSSTPSRTISSNSATSRTADQSGSNGADADHAPRVNLDALLLDYARLAETAGRAKLLEEHVRHLEHQFAAVQESTVALASRNGWLESKLEEREQALKQLTDSKSRRSLWKRIFGSGKSSG